MTKTTQQTELLKAELKTELKELYLTYTDYILLRSIVTLSETRKMVTQADVCKASNSKPMNVSIRLRMLQKRELLKRKEHPIDTRAKTILLTPKGILKVQNAIIIANQLEAKYAENDKIKK